MPQRFHGAVARPEPRRFRVSVPNADISVLTWIGAQSDLSASVRALIRDAIRRDGYQDATCYPVKQQPRRGRPPRSADDDVEVVDIVPSETEATEAVEPEATETAVTVVDIENSGADPEPQQIETALSAPSAPAVSSVPTVTTDRSRSVTEMLGAMR